VPRDAPPGRSALRFYSVYRPAGSVSGDFFDVIPLPNDRVGVFIGDVMGHDVRAALVTAMMRTLVHEQSGASTDPGAMLAEVNRHLQAIFKQAGTVIFATASYLVIDVNSRRVEYANAAHPAPIHVARNGREPRPICRNGDTGPALGLFEQVNYKTCRMDLNEGDRIILFTDGLFEAEAANRDMYGEERLRVSIREQMGLPAEELLNRLLTEAREFTGQRKFADDVCLLAVEVSGTGASRGEN
jgi:serine phosphatase RsbU (regulator of sigma subunit)